MLPFTTIEKRAANCPSIAEDRVFDTPAMQP